MGLLRQCVVTLDFFYVELFIGSVDFGLLGLWRPQTRIIRSDHESPNPDPCIHLRQFWILIRVVQGDFRYTASWYTYPWSMYTLSFINYFWWIFLTYNRGFFEWITPRKTSVFSCVFQRFPQKPCVCIMFHSFHRKQCFLIVFHRTENVCFL